MCPATSYMALGVEPAEALVGKIMGDHTWLAFLFHFFTSHGTANFAAASYWSYTGTHIFHPSHRALLCLVMFFFPIYTFSYFPFLLGIAFSDIPFHISVVLHTFPLGLSIRSTIATGWFIHSFMHSIIYFMIIFPILNYIHIIL